MQFFTATGPCPYVGQPMVALSRTETPVYEDLSLENIEKREELLKRLEAFKAKHGCDKVVAFGGYVLEEPNGSTPEPDIEPEPEPETGPKFDVNDIAPLAPIRTEYDQG